MIRNLFLSFIALLTCNKSISQQREFGFDEPFKLFERNKTVKYEQPPVAYKFLDYSGEGNVNTTNGRFEFTIPFYDLKNDFIELPIGLNYSTSGIKMSEDLSSVGFSWNLVAGGEVTRIVKGMPDDLTSSHNNSTQIHKNAFTGREYHYPNFRGLVPANMGASGVVFFDDEKYLNNSFRTTVAQHPPYFGSMRVRRSNFHVYNFPLRFNHEPTTGNPLGFRPDIQNSVKLSMEELKYIGSKGFNDTQRDIFKVKIGSLDFSFIIQEKILPGVISANYPNNSTQWDTYFEAIPLDEKGVKIEFIKGQTPLYYDWVNEGSTYVRRRIVLSDCIVGFVITDKNGVKYYFDSEFEVQDMEFLAENIDNFFLQNPSEAQLNVKASQWGLESTMTTSWKINRIILPNGKQINYTYNPVIQEHETEVRRSHTGEYKGYRYNLKPLWHPTTNDKYVNKRITTHRLKKITTEKEDIIFEYSSRQDLKSESYSHTVKEVNGITSVYSPGYSFNTLPNLPDDNNYGTNLKKIILKSKISGKTIRVFDLYKTFYGNNASDNYMDKRMFLTSIRDSKKEHSYSFAYNEPNQLKRKNTAAYQDIWGYPKSFSTSHPSFPSFYVCKDNPAGHKIMYTKPKSNNYFLFEGSDRFVDRSTVSIGVLKKILFPTKGYLDIDYESNTYFDSLAYNPNVIGPGLRVRKLSYFDSNNFLSKVKKFEYNLSSSPELSSGNVVNRPSFAYISNDGYDNEIDRQQLEYKYYNLNDNSLFISYNKSKGLLKKGKNYGSNENTNFYTNDYSYLLKKLIRVNNYPLRGSYDNNGNEIIYSEIKETELDLSGSGSSGYIRYTNYYEDNRSQVLMSAGNSDEDHSIDSDLVYGPENLVTPHGSPWTFLKVSFGLMETEGKDIYPFPEREFFGSKGRLNGQLQKIEFFDKNNIKRKEENYSYMLSGESSRAIKNITNKFVLTYAYHKDDPEQKYYQSYRTNGPHGYNSPTYFEVIVGLNFFSMDNILPERKILLSSKEVIQDGIKVKYNYEYDNNFLLTTKASTENSKKELVSKEFVYPFQVPSENANSSLLEKHIINKPVKLVTSINGVTKLKNENSYKNFNINSPFGTKVLLEKQTSKIKTADEFDKIIYDKYDEHDHLLEYHIPNGLPTSIIWGYKNQYPIAEVKNVSYSDVMNIFSSAEKSSILNIVEQGETLQIILDKIRNYFPNALVTTYSYDPLVGLKSVKDPRGYTTYYEYDDFFRLKSIKDDKGNILKHFKYKYKYKR